MTLYRKYRPQKISELDNEEIRNRLSKVLISSYTPHAFLFSGPKGTGKTSAARIIAKSLNCLKRGKDGEPCNECDMCTSITTGNNLDVLEIDAASNRGIDEIRELREKIKLAPLSSHCKVYIIDEVHMLTNEAFNALLKTLEEPPLHAVFILATTEPGRLPETIVSRCITFTFHRATEGEILHALQRISWGEKTKVGISVLEQIARASDGSFRDATKLLEQALVENSATEEKINSILGNDIDSVEKFIDAMNSGDSRTALRIIATLIENGVHMKLFAENVLMTLHKKLLSIHGIGSQEKAIQDITTDNIINLIKLFSRAYTEMKMMQIEHLPLEVAVVEWCQKKEKITQSSNK